MNKPPIIERLYVAYVELPTGEWEYAIGFSAESAISKLRETWGKLTNCHLQTFLGTDTGIALGNL